MTKQELFDSIKTDLSVNLKDTDTDILTDLFNEVVDDALRISNRKVLCVDDTSTNEHITILASNIRKCVKTLYLQRGGEDVSKQSQSGLTTEYDNAISRLEVDIIRTGKRLWM